MDTWHLLAEAGNDFPAAVFMTFLAIFCFGNIYFGFAHGKVLSKHGIATRNESPFMFWLTIVLNSIAGTAISFVVLAHFLFR